MQLFGRRLGGIAAVAVAAWLVGCSDTGAGSDAQSADRSGSDAVDAGDTQNERGSAAGDTGAQDAGDSEVGDTAEGPGTRGSDEAGDTASAADTETGDSGDTGAVVCPQTPVDTEQSILAFGTDGKPSQLVLHGVDRLKQAAGDGFYLVHVPSGDAVFLGHVVADGRYITVSESGGEPSFRFRVDSYPKHVSLHLVEVRGLDSEAIYDYQVRLNLHSTASLGTYALDDLVSGGGNTSIRLRWSYLWGQEKSTGRKGGVAFYDRGVSDDQIDAALASIWVNENLPRPAGQPCWTEADVLAWVDAFYKKYHNLSEMLLEASSPQELYALTDALIFPHGVKRVYLHAKTWRGEYWLYHKSRFDVNEDVFPGGIDDLIAYRNYLAEHGVMLRLHVLSLGIGGWDPDYILPGVDRRLAGWGTGTLAEAVDETATTIAFAPDPGVLPPDVFVARNHSASILYYNYARIDDEIVSCSAIDTSDPAVWTFTGCERGYRGTEPAAHGAGTEAQGLFNAYNKNFVPAWDLDQDDSLMRTLALEYADFINKVGLGHTHWDGPEIHRITPFVERELQNIVYGHTAVPTTSSSVGHPVDANMEKEFSAISADPSIFHYWPLQVDVRLDEPAREKPAVSKLDAHFHVQEAIMLGGRRVTLTVAQSGYGITREVVDTYGLFDEALALFDAWKQLAPVLTQEDVDYIAAVTTKVPGSNHYESEYVLVLEKNAAGKYVFVPTHVMGRTSGEDLPFGIQQEKGTVPRTQSVAAGTALELTNPEAAQELHFVIRVHHEESRSLENPTVTLSNGGSLRVTGTVAPGQYLQYEGGDAAGVYDENWNRVADLPVEATAFAVDSGTNTVTVDDGQGRDIALVTQFIVTGAPYVLTTNDLL